jgi:ribonuclease BN (tRNA processing enzyme)
MSETELTFLGTGDPLASGGRLQTCFHVAAPSGRFLIDCGATAMVAMQRGGIDRNAIEAILVTHLHGDHIGGIPYLILDAQHVSKRTAPLTIAGPPGLETRVRELMDVAFPGLADVEQRFELRFVELEERRTASVGPAEVTPFEVVHACGAPPYALRVEVGGRTIAYSGDTEWTDALVEVSRDADLFVCECYSYEKRIPNHIDYRTLRSHRDELTCDRLVLTHMTERVLSRLSDVEEETAADGMRIAV